MLILPNNRFPSNNSDNGIDQDFNYFKQALSRNSKVYRLIVHNYLKQSVLNLSTWYTISLQLVTEMGLPAPSKQIFPISCHLLVLNHSNNIAYYTTPSNLQIEYRVYEVNDSWRTPDDIRYLSLNSIITYQYRIIATDHEQVPKNLFISFQPVTPNTSNNNNKPLGLCLGPFHLTNNDNHNNVQSQMWDSLTKNSVSLHRVLPLPHSNTYCMFQEIWDNGTAGKLWDSALIMNQVFSMLIQIDKNCLSGLRLLDLSAGIGCVGLYIEMACRMLKTENPPEIILTDLDEALPLMKCNQKLNRIPIKSNVSVKRLRWGSKKDIEKVSNIRNPFDYILVLDVLYNASDFPALIETFIQLIEKNPKATIIMGYKPRGLLPSEENIFFNECRTRLNIQQLNLESLCKEFLGTMPTFQNYTLLETTAVCFYRITKN